MSFIVPVINLKYSIYLNSREGTQNSDICQRIPYFQTNWKSRLNFKIDSGIFSFGYTMENCPFWSISSNMSFWKGFFIHIKKNIEGFSIFLHSTFDEKSSNEELLCNITNINELILNYNLYELNISYLKFPNSSIEICGSSKNIPSIHYGFFSMIQISNINISNTYIYEFNVSNIINSSNSYNPLIFDEINRNYINSKSKINKNKTISPIKKFLSNIQFEINSKNIYENISFLLENINLSLKNTLNIQELQETIENKMKIKLLKIEKKFLKRKNSFINLFNIIQILKRNISIQTRDLRDQVLFSLKNAQKDSILTLSTFLNKSKNVNEIENQTKLNIKEMKSNWIPIFLYIISFIEFFCYLAFFFVKKKASNNFKKYD